MQGDIAPVHRGTVNRNWAVSFYNQWPEVFGRHCNWLDFTFIKLEMERGTYKGKYLEVVVMFMGVGFTWEWWDRNSRAVWCAEMDQAYEEIKDAMGIEDEGDPTDA